MAGDQPQRPAHHEVRRVPAHRRRALEPHRDPLRRRLPCRERHDSLPGPDGAVRRHRDERRPGDLRQGQLQRLHRRRHTGDADPPVGEHAAARTTRPTRRSRLGDSRSRGYDKVHWRTSDGPQRLVGAARAAARAARPTTSAPRSSPWRSRPATSPGQCSPWSNTVSFHPFGPTQGVPQPRVESHDNNSITFTWERPDEQRPADHGLRDRRRPQPDRRCGHARRRRSTASATPRRGPSGSGPSRRTRAAARGRPTVTGTTDPTAAPAEGDLGLQRGGQCGPRRAPPGRSAARTATTSATTWGTSYVPSAAPSRRWSNPDDGTGGSHGRRNGCNHSNKFFGFPNGCGDRDLPRRRTGQTRERKNPGG